jgi:hypothetical protein
VVVQVKQMAKELVLQSKAAKELISGLFVYS